MDTFGELFGARIKVKRGVEGLTQQQLALEAFGDESFKTRISELENGKVANPQQKTVDALVVALNITPEELAECRKRANASSKNPQRLSPFATSQQEDASRLIGKPKRSRRFRYGALGFVVLLLSIAAVRAAIVVKPPPPFVTGTLAKDGKPVVFMTADMVDTFDTLQSILKGVKAELGSGFSTASLEDIGQSGIRFYVLLNWAGLDKINGLQEYCGDKCVPNGGLSFGRVVAFSNDTFGGKDVFIDLSRFVKADVNGTSGKIEDTSLKCLAQVVAREIREYDRHGMPLLDCHKELLKDGAWSVTDRRTSNRSLWYSIQVWLNRDSKA